MKPSDQAPKELARLFSKLHKLQASWRPRDTAVRSSAASDRGRWCLLSFQQPWHHLSSTEARLSQEDESWPLPVNFHSRYTQPCIITHLPNWTLSYGGKQLCLRHSWIPSMFGKGSAVCCFLLDWERVWDTSSEFKGYQPKDEPQVKKLVMGESVE